MIIQINFLTRNVENVYKSISHIDSKEYDRDKVLQCCRGEIDSYGGIYSDMGIWRFMSDVPLLDGYFNFTDREQYFLKVAVPGNTDYDIDNAIYSNNTTSNESYNRDNIPYIKKKRLDTRGFIKIKTNAIVQIQGSSVIRIFPSIDFISNLYFDKSKLLPVLCNNIVEHNGFIWMKYSRFVKNMKSYYGCRNFVDSIKTYQWAI